jgi:hypothetical protein
MSELSGRSPLPPEMRRAALPGGPGFHEERFNAPESDTAVTELQARQLRNRYAVGYCFACSLASLVSGVPR